MYFIDLTYRKFCLDDNDKLKLAVKLKPLKIDTNKNIIVIKLIANKLKSA